MTCLPDYFMQSFSCYHKTASIPVLADCEEADNNVWHANDAGTACEPCKPNWRLDERDSICKRTINDIDYPCEPGTYNLNSGASSDTSCSACSPGKCRNTFANSFAALS